VAAGAPLVLELGALVGERLREPPHQVRNEGISVLHRLARLVHEPGLDLRPAAVERRRLVLGQQRAALRALVVGTVQVVARTVVGGGGGRPDQIARGEPVVVRHGGSFRRGPVDPAVYPRAAPGNGRAANVTTVTFRASSPSTTTPLRGEKLAPLGRRRKERS